MGNQLMADPSAAAYAVETVGSRTRVASRDNKSLVPTTATRISHSAARIATSVSLYSYRKVAQKVRPEKGRINGLQENMP